MPEPDRLEPLASADTERDSRAESLLIEGLDHYFAGQYDNAIHLWTRVLFLDRTHTRARAYIDRARTALAERQRRTDELLETSSQLVGEGQSGPARNLFDEVVAERGEDERVSALRKRIERLEQFERLSTATPRPASPARPEPRPLPAAIQPPRQAWRLMPAMLLVGGLTAVVAGLVAADVPTWLGLRSAGSDLIVNRPAIAPVSLSTSDVALIRARNAMGRGQLAEALRVLERVSADSPVHVEADALRVRIQQTLTASAPNSRTEARRP